MTENAPRRLAELTGGIRSGKRARVKDEIGDILFTVVNLARHFKADPESVLESTTAKFIRRFAEVEREARRTGRSLSAMSLEEMESLWQKSKRKRPKPGRTRGKTRPRSAANHLQRPAPGHAAFEPPRPGRTRRNHPAPKPTRIK